MMVVDAFEQELAEARVALFGETYGEEALDFACHGAFPLVMTTELSYCLRQEFFPELHWSIAATAVLSGLYESVGYDLYEMDAATRSILLKRVVDRFPETQLNELSQFMQGYIAHRLAKSQTEPFRSPRPQAFGDPAEWIALSCLVKNDSEAQEIYETIRRELSTIAQSADVNERFRLASLVDSIGDILAQRGFTAFSMQELAGRVASGQPIDRISEIQRIMEAEGFPALQSQEIEYKTIVFEDAQSIEKLKEIKIEAVTIDRKGKEIDRKQHTVSVFTERLTEDMGIEMVAIPSGKFMMGSPKDEKDRFDWEGPQHEVTVQPFFMSATVVTQAQWRVVAGFDQVLRPIKLNPSNFKGDDRPVEEVSWEDAEEFCLRLSAHAGREWDYQLPTEAQWEYACRAGTTTPFHFGETITSNVANYNASSLYQKEKKGKASSGTTPVKKYLPNSFGLYDCHGNVREWCQDDWHGSYEGAPIDGRAWIDQKLKKEASKVLRGGSWIGRPWHCRSAFRYDAARALHLNNIGFRVVCSASRPLP
jgi:formylglycine-generating enzyme required for sulfatase activity